MYVGIIINHCKDSETTSTSWKVSGQIFLLCLMWGKVASWLCRFDPHIYFRKYLVTCVMSKQDPQNIRVLLLAFPWDVFFLPEPSKICQKVFPRTTWQIHRLPETNMLDHFSVKSFVSAIVQTLEPFHLPANTLPESNSYPALKMDGWEDHSRHAFWEPIFRGLCWEDNLQFCILGRPKNRWTVGRDPATSAMILNHRGPPVFG